MARGVWGGEGDPHVFQVMIRFRLGVSQCQTGFKLRDMLVQDNSEQEVADQVGAVIVPVFKGLLDVGDKVEGVDAKLLGSDTGAWFNVAAPAGTRNIGAGYKISSFMAANVAMKSEIRKRYGQGRMFIPLRSQADVGDDSLTQGGLNLANAWITALTDNFMVGPEDGDLRLVTAHGVLPARGQTANYPGRAEVPASWYDVVTLRVNSITTALRSRKAGVGI